MVYLYDVVVFLKTANSPMAHFGHIMTLLWQGSGLSADEKLLILRRKRYLSLAYCTPG